MCSCSPGNGAFGSIIAGSKCIYKTSHYAWHNLSTNDVLKEIKSTPGGLSGDEVQRRLAEYGPNELEAKKKVPAIVFFLRQFKDIMILVLVAAAVISAFIGEVTDTIVIVVIILINAIIGFVQEHMSEKAMDALKKMAAQHAQVLRNNATNEVPAAELVPGDIVLLEAGNTVPADMRLLEVHALKINEPVLQVNPMR